MVATICAIVTYQRAIAEEQQVCVRVEEGAAGVATEAVNVPSVTRYYSTLVLLENDSAWGWAGARDVVSRREMLT